MMATMGEGVFPALLRYWRGRRGLSQLDLAGASEVSAKHVSFLETGRAQPSREMVLRLAATMDVPLRDQNALLMAAGFAEAFREVPPEGFSPEVRRALESMMAVQEPYPLAVLDRDYELIMCNAATRRLLRALMGDKVDSETNVMRMLFDPTLLRPHVVGWEIVGRGLLTRLQREALHTRHDGRLDALISTLLRYDGVPDEWRVPDFEAPSEPTLCVRFRVGTSVLGFLVTLTVFQAPQNVSLQELRIESYFPLDDATEALCRALAAND